MALATANKRHDVALAPPAVGPLRRTLLVAAVCAAGHLPIINSDNEVVGMVTRKDLHKGSDFSKEQFQNEAMGEIISAAL